MDDMFLQCNKNTIYVLNSNSAFRYGEFDMIGLFGSPAGRALTESPSINDKTSAQTSAQTVTSKNISRTHSTLNTNLVNNDKPNRSGIGGDGGHNGVELNKRKNFIFKTNIRKTRLWKFFDDDYNNNSSNSNNNNIKKNSVEDLSTGSFSQNSYTKKRIKNNQKSSKELYREAATLLGLSCSLSDNCRCLDCQSRYFDCDDSDSYSDISNLEINERNQDTTSINNFAAGADIDVGGLHVASTEGDYDEVDEDDVDEGDVDNCYRERRALGSSDGIAIEEDMYKREFSDTHSVYELHNDDIIA